MISFSSLVKMKLRIKKLMSEIKKVKSLFLVFYKKSEETLSHFPTSLLTNTKKINL
jgi:hypothetical protein